MNTWDIVLAVVGGLALLWAALIVSLYIAGRRRSEPTDCAKRCA
jgi:hypothetical protein